MGRLLVGIVCIAFFGLFLALSSGIRFGYNGYYQNGKVTLWASKFESYADYRLSSDHEWGHHVYQTMLAKEDLKAWKKIVNTCGYEGGNAKLYRSSTVKYEEEFADSYAMMKSAKPVCESKSEILRKFD